MSSTKDLTPLETAYTSEFLVSAGEKALPVLLAAGEQLLHQAREAAGLSEWPSQREESRSVLATAALELRQLAEWLSDDGYVLDLIRQKQPEAAFLRFLANAAAPTLAEIAESFGEALAVPPEECEAWAETARRSSFSYLERPASASRESLLQALEAVVRARGHLHQEAADAEDPAPALALAGRLEAFTRHHLRPGLAELAMNPLAVAHLDGEPAKVLQARLRLLARTLRLAVPQLRELGEEVREGLGDETGSESFPALLVGRMDGLLSEGLCKAVVELEALQRADASNPDPVPASFLALWRELDPAAPPAAGDVEGGDHE